MKKISLTLIGLYVGLFAGFAQSKSDSSKYYNTELTFEEANIVSSYYKQDGNNSAVTGGIGTEKLTDISNTFDVKFYRYDSRFRKHNWNFELGIDHFTSASADMVDLKANSSASRSDTRIYPSINWTVENEQKGTTVGAGVSYSHEFDYTSFSTNLNFALKTKNRSGEFSAKLQTFFDKVNQVIPTELLPVVVVNYSNVVSSASRGGGSSSGSFLSFGSSSKYPAVARNTADLALSYAQIINKRFQVMIMGDIVAQSGYLSLPFHRVYFKDNTVHQEVLPDSRIKLPIALRANYFVGDQLILRGYYRFYTDDWGLTAHTASIETPIKLSSFFSISPFFRYYIQTAIKYFGAYKTHTAQENYYTSNYDYSAFTSNFFGAGIRLTPPNGIFGNQKFEMIELRYGHYTKDIGMQSDIISVNLKFK